MFSNILSLHREANVAESSDYDYDYDFRIFVSRAIALCSDAGRRLELALGWRHSGQSLQAVQGSLGGPPLVVEHQRPRKASAILACGTDQQS